MTQDIRDFITASHELVGLGEPTHGEPALGRVRNTLFTQLVECGFRSIAFESDRVSGLRVNDFVQSGIGNLDEVMRDGFTHGFGAFDANRELVSWMREYNRNRPREQRLAFHGMDAPLEFTAASPRRDLEYGRDYLGIELDLAGLIGDDDTWERVEAVTDPAASPGDTAEARQLRALADDMLTSLYARAPELIPATSLEQWRRAKIHLTSGLGLLRYHRQAAQRIADSHRWGRLGATRGALMAANLLDIRDIEARRGPTAVLAHNAHLQLTRSHMSTPDMEVSWFSTGAILAPLLGERHTFIIGEQNADPVAPQAEAVWWRLTAAGAVEADMTLDGADAVLHVSNGMASAAPASG